MPTRQDTPPVTASRQCQWAHTIDVGMIPLCPTCGSKLQPPVTVYFAGMAFCEPCVRGPLNALHSAIMCATDPRAAKHLSLKRGLTYYVPLTFGPATLFERLYHDWEIGDSPSGPNGPTEPQPGEGLKQYRSLTLNPNPRADGPNINTDAVRNPPPIRHESDFRPHPENVQPNNHPDT